MKPVLRRDRADAADVDGLPPNYDGWLQYTATNTTPPTGYSVFTGEMSVPDIPAEVPQMLYLFPGLQNYDWIPKVDPLPTSATPFDIIQPVLQYPGMTPDSWGVRSWYVTVNEGARMSELLTVKPGDAILCNMTHLGDINWFIGSKIKSTGKETNQLVSRLIPGASERMKLQPWAYNTVECYGCTGCGTYPKTPVAFTNLALKDTNGQTVVPKWSANPKPAKDEKCHEATQINGPSSVTMSFQ